MPRSPVCPKCSSDAIKRTHRQGLKERLASLFFRYPYRCRKCNHRFVRIRISSGSARTENKVPLAFARRREIILYGVGILFFLALLSFIVRERSGSSDGN